MITWDPYARDPVDPDVPKGTEIEDVISDSAEWLDGIDELDEKYPPGFLKG